jgi:predicted nuclease with TOPRIM domain
MSNHESTEGVSDDAPNKSVVKMTISDYARATGMAESAIRTRIARGQLNTVREIVNNRQAVFVLAEEVKDMRSDVPLFSLKNDSLINEKTEALHQAQVQNARLEERLQTLTVKIESLEAIIESLKSQLADKAETISSQKMANEALNSERLNVTQQLQKYREPERKWWDFLPWNRV